MTQFANSTYTYDADGYRLTRTVNGVEYKYIWVDGLLMSQTWGNEIMIFLYDEVGSPIGFGYRYGSGDSYDYYYYEKNLQGDIVGIFDQSGTRIVEYTYDAWGDIQSMNGQGAYPLGFNNPFRYRGYYFDYETNLYYLQSRYYDPVNGRFISPDTYITTGQGLQSYNMYTYCGNDPVNRIDPTGEAWGWIVAIAAVVIVLAFYIIGEKEFDLTLTEPSGPPTNDKVNIYDDTGAFLVKDYRREENGLPVLGHARAIIKDYEENKWYRIEYTGKFPFKNTAKVIIVEIKDIEKYLQDEYYNKGGKYTILPLEGDYSGSIEVANQHKGTNYGKYNLVWNNCYSFINYIIRVG